VALFCCARTEKASTSKSCPRYARAAQVLFSRLSLLVDCRLGDFGERLVRGLFLIQRFLKQFDGVIETELFRADCGSECCVTIKPPGRR
jgi:hypothetical protein